MRPRRRDSLTWRVLLILGGAFALTALVELLVLEHQVGRMLVDRVGEVHGSRIEVIATALTRRVERLSLTGDPEAYRADFQEAFLRHVAGVHYDGDLSDGFAYIIDDEGTILLHPGRERGAVLTADLLASIRAAATSMSTFVYDDEHGGRRFVSARRAPAWNWYIVHEAPLGAVLADTRRIERQLLVTWLAITALVLVAMALVLRREIRPVLALAEAADAMSRGDLDRAIDTHPPGEVGVLARAFVQMRDAIRRQLEEVRESETRYRKIFDAGTDGLLLIDDTGHIVAANPSLERTHGWSQAQLVGQPLRQLLPDEARDLVHELLSPPADRHAHRESITLTRSGEKRVSLISTVRLRFQGRAHVLASLRDMTEQRELEDQLRQSQKLESVGRLAGGIAHDFNNLLTPVIGYTEMLLDDPKTPESVRQDLTAVRRAGERARTLAQQLLAFSRRQVLSIEPINLGEVALQFEPILRRTLREDIDLELERSDGDCQVDADPGQIEQILMNLVVNAMDAMPDGGRITIRTECVQEQSIGDGPEATCAARLLVRDTGTGVPEEMMENVFEPFFTTKEVGKGTGLGLSTIHGIVVQHGGTVNLRNHPRGGCEVEVRFPCDPALIRRQGETAEDVDPDAIDGHGELIWLVEDEAMVRDLVGDMLRRRGYEVRSFASGHDCLISGGSDPAAALLITDVVMPRMSGPELRDRLREQGLTMPVLFMSGHANETLVQRGLSENGSSFIGKPLDPRQLLPKIRRLLDGD